MVPTDLISFTVFSHNVNELHLCSKSLELKDAR